MNRIKVGDKMPVFSLPDQDGNIFDIGTVLGRKQLVIFFYPKDNSLGCTREACYFQDLSEVFEEAGAMIIGISGQSSESHKKFAEKNNLKYTLLSDTGDRIRKLFGVPYDFLGTVPGRATYVVSKDGRIAYIFNSQSRVERHVDEALKICLLLKKSDTVDA